jgi:hypothetical protein
MVTVVGAAVLQESELRLDLSGDGRQRRWIV